MHANNNNYGNYLYGNYNTKRCVECRYKNCTVWIISSDLENMKMIGLKPTKKINLMNANLKCSFREFKIYVGSKKSKYKEN